MNYYYKKMQNEPNFKNIQISLTYVKTSNYVIFRPLQHPKNEPKTNPIYAQFAINMLSWPAVRMISTYSSQGLRNTVCPSSRPPAKTAYLFRTTNKNMQNEPNFKNALKFIKSLKIMVCDNFHPLERQKNEPKTNPIFPAKYISTHTKLRLREKKSFFDRDMIYWYG
jgi:hypothetical protein